MASRKQKQQVLEWAFWKCHKAGDMVNLYEIIHDYKTIWAATDEEQAAIMDYITARMGLMSYSKEAEALLVKEGWLVVDQPEEENEKELTEMDINKTIAAKKKTIAGIEELLSSYGEDYHQGFFKQQLQEFRLELAALEMQNKNFEFKKLEGQYVTINQDAQERYNMPKTVLVEQVLFCEQRGRYEAKIYGTIEWFPVYWVVSIETSRWNGLHWEPVYTPIEEFLAPITDSFINDPAASFNVWPGKWTKAEELLGKGVKIMLKEEPAPFYFKVTQAAKNGCSVIGFDDEGAKRLINICDIDFVEVPK